MAASDDANLDELRRRARRRLVGAIVLALAVAVFVPMLLESDPKPLGEDVSVKIPPVDDGKFVNRLNDKGKGEAPRTAAKAEPKAEAPKVAAEPPKADAPKEEPAKTEAPKDTHKEPPKEPPREPAKETPKEPSKDAAKEAAKDPAPAPQVAKAAPEPAPAPKDAPAKDAPPKEGAAKDAPSKDAAAKDTHAKDAGEFSVQVFAFSDDKGANSLVNKLKAKGFPAYSEPVTTSRGTLWRVRVGPYPSRDGANAARDKLKGEGYNGIVAAAK